MNAYCFKVPSKPNRPLKSPKLKYSLEVFAQNATPHVPGFSSPLPLWGYSSGHNDMSLALSLALSLSHTHMCICFLYISKIFSYSLWKDVGGATLFEIGIRLANENDGLFTHHLSKSQNTATIPLKQILKWEFRFIENIEFILNLLNSLYFWKHSKLNSFPQQASLTTIP